MAYRDALDADRRLVILQLLEKSTGYTANEYTIYAALPGFGHEASMDRVRTDLAWLDEQGLVALDAPGGVHLAKLTQRGLDVATGRATVDGVKRPGPGE